ncbi:E3 ubiquitin-protein ligase TRIM62-like isoform X3 [Lampetra planeri]
MASAAPSGSEAPGELTCPICLDAFRCPCTLSCGHSFCLKCVEGVWDAAESFSCPQCRVTFPQRPKLNKSFTLANLVEQRSAAKKMATVVLCDFCNDGTTSASKTCLKCDTSYCATHVKPHQENQKFRRHILVAPGTNPEDRKCKTHRKRIKFYCRQDKSLVCTTCTIAGDHKRHNVAKLEDEHKTREKQIGEETRAVEGKRREAEESVRRMEAARRDVQGSITDEKASISVRFAHARAALDAEEKAALEQAEKKWRKLLSLIEKKIAHDQREISELQAAATRLQALAQERDSLTFLQGHLEEKRRKKTTITHDSTQDNMGLSVGTGRATAAPPSTPSQEDIASLKGTEGTVAKLLYGRSPTLDTNSAHKKLQISSDLRTMTLTGSSQCRPDHPHRFNSCPQALCRESFSSGHHYWEVDVEDARMWRVGVAYGTIPRKMSGGAPHLLGDSDTSWCLEKSDNLFSNKFSVFHGGVKTALSVRGAPSPSRIGLHLHWEGGLLAFYRADSMEVIHEKQVGDETRAVEEKKRKAEESIKQMEAARRDVQGHLEETRRIGRATAAPPSAPSQEDIASLKATDDRRSPTLDINSAHNQLQISSNLRTMTWTSASQGRPDHPHRGTWRRLADGRSPTLDTNSAHHQLQISSDLRTMTEVRASKRRPDHPHRFDGHAQALCRESFSSGHHYWEVDVGDVRWWRVGFAYGTIPRKGNLVAQQLGGNNASWCLEKRDDSFSVVHGGVKTALSVRGAPSPRRIGLHLHWEEGLLAFYRADSMEVIHEVRHRFLQPLYSGMCVHIYNKPLKIVDLSRAS